MLLPGERGQCYRILRERLGFETQYDWSVILVEHGHVGSSRDATRKLVGRWETGESRPSSAKVRALARTIAELGFRRQRGGPVSTLLSEEMDRAVTVSGWLQAYDLARSISESFGDGGQEARVRLVSSGRTFDVYECFGPGSFYVLQGEALAACFSVEEGRSQRLSTPKGSLVTESLPDSLESTGARMMKSLRRTAE